MRLRKEGLRPRYLFACQPESELRAQALADICDLQQEAQLSTSQDPVEEPYVLAGNPA